MKIVVLVKQVPDTWAEKRLDPDTLTVDRASVDGLINEMDEFAVEEALQLAEKHGGEVTVVCMGPEGATDAYKKALQMGVDKAVFLTDPALAGSDAVGTSYALAQVLGTLEYDLVILGSEASDARTSIVPALLAERLGLPQLTFASKVEVDGTSIKINRQTDYGHDVVEAGLPAVVSVVEKINEPRYPSFKGIMAAKKKPVQTLDAAAAAIDTARVGAVGSWSKVLDATVTPPRSKGTIVTDEGSGGVELADFLATKKFV
ncbi:electron transfer flavoprotein subunit beta/FixA family protein [Actinocrinis puniceicyclus]|uniref:Electron transfer flavoprotein subunit beta n=1 Tax=Actinocrinis puniceicyclus TaxID=977794 RepID=A0A8J7WGP4_9ACTN|nr:electron transfer flavoprotein subunit beta/FixA family protein [Actinocrinis puniceicyclus]MBS2961811.1 electron transfer flavoprotein subunit beta/FixA family protein [Actinocrinis puniceicyclus]